MKLTLISYALCPYVQRAVIALQEKNIPFERMDIDLRKKPTWFLALSPFGKTPVLLANDQPIFESAVICEYLEDMAGPALHPRDPLARAKHRAWIEFASTTLNNVWTFYTEKSDDAYSTAAMSLVERFVQLEGAVRDGPYFDGANFSLVDAAYAPLFRYFDVFDEISGISFFVNTPKVRAWRRALSARPSVQRAVSADYATLLQEFLIDQGGVLGQRFVARA